MYRSARPALVLQVPSRLKVCSKDQRQGLLKELARSGRDPYELHRTAVRLLPWRRAIHRLRLLGRLRQALPKCITAVRGP